MASRIFLIGIMLFSCINLLSGQKTLIVKPNYHQPSRSILSSTYDITDQSGKTTSHQYAFEVDPITLKDGRYTLSYKTIFGNTGQEIFDFELTDTVELVYYLDSLTCEEDSLLLQLLENLKVGDQYQLFFTSGGCFHYDKDSLTVFKQKDQSLILKHREENYLVDEEIFRLLLKIENVIACAEMSMSCTTHDTYLIKLNGIKVAALKDGSCRWNGFLYLIGRIRQKAEQKTKD